MKKTNQYYMLDRESHALAKRLFYLYSWIIAIVFLFIGVYVCYFIDCYFPIVLYKIIEKGLILAVLVALGLLLIYLLYRLRNFDLYLIHTYYKDELELFIDKLLDEWSDNE